MRTLPGTSPAHRLWAGTKIGMLLAVAVVPVVDPSWPALGGSALVLAAWARAGRVPRGAWPRPPAWLLVWAGAGIALAALGNQRPLVSVLGFTVSLGGLNQAALFFGIALVSLVAATILVWTTSVSAIPPLLRRLTGWAAAVRLPLANCCAAIALGLRMAPMLLDDSRTILHLVGQRRRSGPRRPRVLAASGCAGSPAGRPSPVRTRPDEPPRPPTPSPRGVGSGSSPGPTDVPAARRAHRARGGGGSDGRNASLRPAHAGDLAHRRQRWRSRRTVRRRASAPRAPQDPGRAHRPAGAQVFDVAPKRGGDRSGHGRHGSSWNQVARLQLPLAGDSAHTWHAGEDPALTRRLVRTTCITWRGSD